MDVGEEEAKEGGRKTENNTKEKFLSTQAHANTPTTHRDSHANWKKIERGESERKNALIRLHKKKGQSSCTDLYTTSEATK